MSRWAPPPGPNSSLSPRPRPCVLLDGLPPSERRTCSSKTPLPPSAQDHGLFARRNKFGTFQVKIGQKTETCTKTQKTKTTMTKQKNETTVADKMPTAAQRAVHFRTLAIIGVAAACGLSVPASGPRCMLHLHTL